MKENIVQLPLIDHFSTPALVEVPFAQLVENSTSTPQQLWRPKLFIDAIVKWADPSIQRKGAVI